MPGSLSLGPTASISVMTAPQPEATTTPVSSSRAGVQLPVPWARPKTRKVDRERAGEGGTGEHEGAGPGEHGGQCTHGGAAGDAEDVGVSQRVAQQDLHERAGHREQTARGEAGQGPGARSSQTRVWWRLLPCPVITAQRSAGAMGTLPTATATRSATTPSSASQTNGRKGRHGETARDAGPLRPRDSTPLTGCLQFPAQRPAAFEQARRGTLDGGRGHEKRLPRLVAVRLSNCSQAVSQSRFSSPMPPATMASGSFARTDSRSMRGTRRSRSAKTLRPPQSSTTL